MSLLDNLSTPYSTADLGYSPLLIKGEGISSSLLDATPEMSHVISSGVAPQNLTSGDIVSQIEQAAGVIFNGKTDFTNTDAGYRLGTDISDELVKFYIGNSTNYLNWDGTTLTIAGAISVTVGGTIGGFDIGSDYIRDAADSFGLASTVSGGNDVRFWAGATFSNRATAPARIYEDGAAVFESITISGYVITSGGSFGGDGTDGALAVSSGTTTLDLNNAKVVVFNYTSISITGTGQVAFSNPHSTGTYIIMKSQGDVTITSSTTPCIDASAMGAAGGAAVTVSSGGSASAGNAGNDGYQNIFTCHKGTGATASAVGTGGAAISFAYNTVSQLLNKYPAAFVGAGAGSGMVGAHSAGVDVTSGKGGNGGPALIIECGGALNFTTASGISVAGEDGGDYALGGSPSGTDYEVGGGGGGGGGYCLILYNSLTAASGTIVVSAGSGGLGISGLSGGTYYGGGGGGSVLGGGNGTSSTDTGGAQVGGGGGAGISEIAENVIYA